MCCSDYDWDVLAGRFTVPKLPVKPNVFMSSFNIWIKNDFIFRYFVILCLFHKSYFIFWNPHQLCSQHLLLEMHTKISRNCCKEASSWDIAKNEKKIVLSRHLVHDPTMDRVRSILKPFLKLLLSSRTEMFGRHILFICRHFYRTLKDKNSVPINNSSDRELWVWAILKGRKQFSSLHLKS